MELVAEPDEYRIWFVLGLLVLIWAYVFISQVGFF